MTKYEEENEEYDVSNEDSIRDEENQYILQEEEEDDE